MGYCPRLTILHTSDREIGQIYVPSVNKMLMLLTIALVLGFQKRSVRPLAFFTGALIDEHGAAAVAH